MPQLLAWTGLAEETRLEGLRTTCIRHLAIRLSTQGGDPLRGYADAAALGPLSREALLLLLGTLLAAARGGPHR